MKFFIVLALVLAVSSAASTGNLVQQSQPLMQKLIADLSLNFHARSSAEAGLQAQFVNAIQDQIAGVLVQVQTTVKQLRDSFQVPAHISALIQSILARPNVDATIQASTVYICLKQELGLEGNSLYAHLQALNAAGNLNVEFLTSSPAIQECLAQQGGVEGLIANSAIIAQAQALVASLNLQDVVHAALIRVLGEELGNYVIDLLSQNARGVFGNIWNGATNVAGNVWDGISGAAVGLITNLASNAWNSAAERLELIKQIALEFLNSGIDSAQELGLEALENLIDSILPNHANLG